MRVSDVIAALNKMPADAEVYVEGRLLSTVLRLGRRAVELCHEDLDDYEE